MKSANERSTILEKIYKFFSDESDLPEELRNVGPDESLISGALIDSLGVLKIVAFIETEFSIQLDPEEVNLENFDTLGAITKLIQTHLL